MKINENTKTHRMAQQILDNYEKIQNEELTLTELTERYDVDAAMVAPMMHMVYIIKKLEIKDQK